MPRLRPEWRVRIPSSFDKVGKESSPPLRGELEREERLGFREAGENVKAIRRKQVVIEFDFSEVPRSLGVRWIIHPTGSVPDGFLPPLINPFRRSSSSKVPSSKHNKH